MKKKFLLTLLWLSVAVISLWAIWYFINKRATTPSETLRISDRAGIISDQKKEEYAKLLDSSSLFETIIYTIPDTMGYEQALSYMPDSLSFLQRKLCCIVRYHQPEKAVFISIPFGAQNVYDKSIAVPMYHIRHDMYLHSDEDNLDSIITQISNFAHQDITFSMANSILSIVEYLYTALVIPSKNLLHLMFFHLPLLAALTMLGALKSITWAFVIVLILIFTLIIATRATSKHVLLYQLLSAFVKIVFVCLIFLCIPMYDTVVLVRDLGFEQASVVLDSVYMNSSATSPTIIGGILFALLYVFYTFFFSEVFAKKAQDGTWDPTGEVLMLILVFFMPRCVVWAVCAYLLQLIICCFIKDTSRVKGQLAPSDGEMTDLLFAMGVYFEAIILWWFHSLYPIIWHITIPDSIFRYIFTAVLIILWGLYLFGTALIYYSIENVSYFARKVQLPSSLRGFMNVVIMYYAEFEDRNKNQYHLFISQLTETFLWYLLFCGVGILLTWLLMFIW